MVSCGKKETVKEADPVNETKAARYERRVPREEEEIDPRMALREAFESASREAETVAREKALEVVAWDAIDVDPALAREAFDALDPDGAASRKLMAHFAMRMADDDPEAALEWVRSLQQPEQRNEAVGRVAVVVSARDPERAAALVVAEMKDGLQRDRAIVQILQRWGQSAPADAAEWVADFPQGAARSAGMKAVTAAWIESDPPALAAWVEAREVGALRSEAMLAVVAALRPANTEVRRKYLDAFEDLELRKQLESMLSQVPR